MQPDAATFERVLTQALGAGEYADAFYERRVARSFRFQDGRVHEAGITVSSGVGIRVLAGERAGYAYSDDLSVEALLATARTASLIAKDGSARVTAIRVRGEAELAPSVYLPSDPTSLVAESATYVDLLARADVAARAADPASAPSTPSCRTNCKRSRSRRATAVSCATGGHS